MVTSESSCEVWRLLPFKQLCYFDMYMYTIGCCFLFIQEERSISVMGRNRSPHNHVFNSREFTFPETNWKRKKQFPSQPSILPALTPRIRDTPLHAKIEKLAKQRRKERVTLTGFQFIRMFEVVFCSYLTEFLTYFTSQKQRLSFCKSAANLCSMNTCMGPTFYRLSTYKLIA